MNLSEIEFKSSFHQIALTVTLVLTLLWAMQHCNLFLEAPVVPLSLSFTFPSRLGNRVYFPDWDWSNQNYTWREVSTNICLNWFDIKCRLKRIGPNCFPNRTHSIIYRVSAFASTESRQGAANWRTFAPTNESADCWSAANSYNFNIWVK